MQRPARSREGFSPRIAFVTKGLGRGGTETHLLRVLPRLIDNGIDLKLFALQRGGALEADFARAGISLAGGLPCANRIVGTCYAALGLARFLREYRPDAVHYFLPEPYLMGAMLSPVVGAPMRLMSRRSLANYQSKYPLLGLLEKLAHRKTAALIGNSKAVVAELLAEAGKSGKIGLIANGVPMPPGISEDQRAAAKEALGLPAQSLNIIVVANLIPYKGHADLLSGLALATKDLPACWRLLVVGRDEGILANLQAYAGRLGIASNILWLGERNDVPSLLQFADLAVLASHEEGSPNSLIEAMMCGLPVVATAVGGNAEIVETGIQETGELVPSHDPKSLGAAIVRVLNDGPRRKAMAQRGQARAMEHFSLEACVSRYAELYRGLDAVGTRPLQEILDVATPRDFVCTADI